MKETSTLPVPKVVAVFTRWGRAGDDPNRASHSNNSTSNTSQIITNVRTLTPKAETDANSLGDFFVFSKQSVQDAANVSLNASERTKKDGGDETVSVLIRNGGMLIDDVPAKDPSKDNEKPVVDPVVKDLSGYESVVNAKSHLYIKCSQCAYVSSSGQLLGTKAGELIDSYPCVIRMNNAPTKGFEADVGSKTTVRVVAHSAIPGVYSQRFSLLKGPGQPKFIVVWGPDYQMKKDGKGKAFNIATTLYKQFYKDGMQVFALSPHQISYADKVFEMETGRNRISSGSWLSTGWFTMMLARGICDEITVFGMVKEDHCKLNLNSKVPYHYYQAQSIKECSLYRSSEKAKKNSHRFMTEKGVFSRWSKQEPRISFKYPDWSARK
nr:alpha-N-acetyl-neuraminyl-2,3-beta-galactosyl-1,3-N-acetyl-galactosaminide alpha-2,6-sialyltransferase-like [Lytechinus pictus]